MRADDSLEPAGKSDVIRIHSRHVRPPSDVEADVQRAGESRAASRSAAPEAAGPRLPRARRRCRRRSRRRRRPARDRRPSGGGRSARLPRSSPRRRERRGRRTRAGWPRPAEGSLRRWRERLQTSASTSSSRRSTAPTELEALLASLEGQTHRPFALVVVDQNADDRVAALLASHAALDVLHLRSSRGLSRARNAALPALDADSRRVPRRRLPSTRRISSRGSRGASRPTRSSTASRAARSPPTARRDASWERRAGRARPANLWNRVISFSIFLRRGLVERVGRLRRAARARVGLAVVVGRGGRLRPPRDPDRRPHRVRPRPHRDPRAEGVHVVRSFERWVSATGRASAGSCAATVRRTHGRPHARSDPSVGSAPRSLRGDLGRARFHAATLRGRVRGYLGGSRRRARAGASKSAAWRSSQSVSANRSTARARAAARVPVAGRRGRDRPPRP